MKRALRVFCGCALLLAHVVAPAAGLEAKPNILLVTADDLGLQLSCYGEKNISTPTLDSLAREGVRFSNAYVAQSSCSSSRASMLTSRWPHQNGQIGLAHLGFRMQPGQPNLVALLKSAGYHTGIIGKLHVEPKEEYPFDWMPKKKVAAGPTRDVKWVAEEARAFFATSKAAGRPFFFYVNYFDPHGPLNAETDQVNGIPEKPLRPPQIKEPLPFGPPTEQRSRGATARVLNTILRLDTGMGMLLDELKAAGVAENTVVVFLGDNGLAAQRGKGTAYELGLRVPLVVRWPGVAKPGQTREELVSLLDVMPTLLDAAGLKSEGFAGEPLQPLLRDQPAQWRTLLFAEMNFHEPQQCRPQRTVRDKRYKLLRNLASTGEQKAVELFDLQNDPWETNNLSEVSALAEVRKALEGALTAWQQRTSDPLADSARVQRWTAAAERWNKLPRVQAAAAKVVHIPEGELDLLR